MAWSPRPLSHLTLTCVSDYPVTDGQLWCRCEHTQDSEAVWATFFNLCVHEYEGPPTRPVSSVLAETCIHFCVFISFYSFNVWQTEHSASRPVITTTHLQIKFDVRLFTDRHPIMSDPHAWRSIPKLGLIWCTWSSVQIMMHVDARHEQGLREHVLTLSV